MIAPQVEQVGASPENKLSAISYKQTAHPRSG
jgi:hypothetical protein